MHPYFVLIRPDALFGKEGTKRCKGDESWGGGVINKRFSKRL